MIPPGKTSSIEVRYTARSQTADERRTVEIEFREADVPPVRLVILAQVREALTVEPRELVFTRVALGSESEAHLKVFNFSDAAWEGIEAKSSVAWLRASAVVEQREGFAPARQAWRVTCVVDAGQLGTGRFTGTLTLRARGRDDLEMLIPVTVDVTAPLVAIPGQLHFGEVRAGVAASKTILLRFADDIAPRDAGEITLRHDLAVDLSIECRTHCLEDQPSGGYECDDWGEWACNEVKTCGPNCTQPMPGGPWMCPSVGDQYGDDVHNASFPDGTGCGQS